MGETLTAEPSSDPAAATALKRRLERQIREAYGDRLRSLNVRVTGREVAVEARAAYFWQRRAIRRFVEGLPLLSGYHSVVVVN